MDDQTPQTNPTPPPDGGNSLLSSLTPDSIKKPVQDVSDKLSEAADGADDVANNLEQTMDKGLKQVEDGIDNFLTGLDKFLGKF